MARKGLALTTDQQKELALSLVDDNLFGVAEDTKDYTALKSGRRSPHYLDIRPGISRYDTRLYIAQALVDLAIKHTGSDVVGVDYVVGSPEAMTSYATSISDLLHMGVLQPRVGLNKVSGNKTPIIGKYSNNEKVAIFDDGITDGDTKITIINALEAEGLKVQDYYVVLDREEGGIPKVIQETGVNVTAALGVSSLVRLLYTEGKLNQTQYNNVAHYLTEFGEPHAQELMSTAI